ncbi:DUF4290 domain-containing protein [Flavobacterium difficile]|uniref:DUF4290 domain-containing protein n=1 Tax=Flavobacterium difficile TaxID=2709659 RepID=A0ABX0I687_9FLAO|nr:DUF4290 domain-containing protein [Flavobacterium difficile]NHM02132.1 DUF4290 domain-containing protein [Flavobacterium difficile]
MSYINEEAINYLEYNSQREHLIIPEYGRYVQKLINEITAIEDREKRNKGARYVISVLGNLNPHLRDVPDFQHKLWDQLFIMSDFKLDIDSPYPIPTREVVQLKPQRLAYPQNFPKYRFYGNNIKYMIDVARKWEDGELKNALIIVIANHMKKCFLSWNKDTVTDEVIFNHLLELSNGELNLTAMKEELSTSQNLLKVNKKQSNKTQFFPKGEASNTNRNQSRPSSNQNRAQTNTNRNSNATSAKPNSPDNNKANLNNPNYKGGKNFKPKNNPNTNTI